MALFGQDSSSSGFGLDASDAKAVREMRRRMDEIRKRRPTVALVLSGGGAKGAATVGALNYLEQYKFPVDMVVGTSIGGLIGGVYAMGYSPLSWIP
jgi:Predicted esterase of the alpha-beta hydrolase superfamily